MKYPNENHHFAPSFGQKMFFSTHPTSAKSKFCSGYRCWLPASGMSIRLQIWICLVATSDAWQKEKPWPSGARPSKKRSRGLSLNLDKWFLNRKFWEDEHVLQHYFPKKGCHLLAGWWFQLFFMFIPLWGNDPFWRAYFSDGLKPRTSWVYWEGDVFLFSILFCRKVRSRKLPIHLWEIGVFFPPTWSVALHLRDEKLPSY